MYFRRLMCKIVYFIYIVVFISFPTVWTNPLELIRIPRSLTGALVCWSSPIVFHNVAHRGRTINTAMSKNVNSPLKIKKKEALYINNCFCGLTNYIQILNAHTLQ